MKQLLKNESGQSIVLTLVSLTTIIGFLGLAVDVGLLFRTKQNAQIAADAAAVAATQNLLFGGNTASAQAAGIAAATENGYTNGSGGVTVTINNPPASGPNTGSSYVEAIISKSKGMSFATVLGRNSTVVAARAVAGTPVYGTACIWLMAPTQTGLTVQGSYTINIKKCGIYVNSPDSNDVNVTGNGGSSTAAFLDTTGNTTAQHATTPTPITKNTAHRSNPWGDLQGYSPSDCTPALTFSPPSGQSSINITSGSGGNNATYNVGTNGSVVCFTAPVVLNSGVAFNGAANGVTYLFESGVEIATGATVSFGSVSNYNATTNTYGTTSGATIELYGGTLKQDSNSILNLYAPTAGTMNAIGIFQPDSNHTNPLQVQFGSNGSTFDGYVFDLNGTVYMQDSGGSGVKNMGIVAHDMNVQTSNFSISSYDAANATTTPNRIVTLVE